VVWKYAKMHQNTFFITLTVKNMKMHENTFLTTPDSQKYLFLKKFLVVWKYVQMHQNTSLTTPDSKKYLFLKKSFWLSGSMRKCMKTRF
jgi:hypothetical protein